MGEQSNEALARAFAEEVAEKAKRQKAEIAARKSAQKGKGKGTEGQVSAKSNGLEGIAVEGRNLGDSRIDNMTDVEAETGIKGARSEATVTLPSELAGRTRGRLESPTGRVEGLNHDKDGWFRMIGGQKVYEKKK